MTHWEFSEPGRPLECRVASEKEVESHALRETSSDRMEGIL